MLLASNRRFGSTSNRWKVIREVEIVEISAENLAHSLV